MDMKAQIMWQESYFALENNATLQIMEKTSIRNTAFGMKIEDERTLSFSQLNELSTEMPLTCVEKVKLFQREVKKLPGYYATS